MTPPPSQRLRSALSGIVVTCAAALSLAACGGGAASSPDLENGKVKFKSSCGGCHTLADAGTKGDVTIGGPNLDDAFRGPREEEFKTSAFEAIIRYWIHNPEQRTDPKMPPDLVTGKDAEDVAAYIAAKAGVGTEDSPARPAEPID